MAPPSVGFNLLVDSYDKAIAFYASTLRLFDSKQNTDAGNGLRTVFLDFHQPAIPFWMTLTLATTANERSLVGRQAGNSILLVLPVRDLESLVERLGSSDVRFDGPLLNLPYGRQAVCFDPFGNRVSLFERYALE